MKLTKEVIISTLREKEDILVKKYDVKHLILFGSYASDKQNENSDIDILVEFKGKYNFSNELDLQVYLYHLFKKNIGLIEINNIEDDYRDYILKEHKKIEIY